MQALRSALRGAVDDSTRRRAEYSTDASNYRVVPQVVAFPQDTDDVLAALAVVARARRPADRARRRHVGGRATRSAPGVVLDFSRHVNRILDIDPDARTARIEPGVVMAEPAEGRRAARPAVRARPVARRPARRSAG